MGLQYQEEMMPATKSKLTEIKFDISESNREKLVDLLNQSLANTADLVSQVKQAHWNVKGMHFWELHKLFDAVYESLEEYVDTIAERVTTLGGSANGTVRMAAANSKLSEFPKDLASGEEFVTAVRDRLASYASTVRSNIDKSEELDDPTTADLYTEISRVVDLQLYFLESHLH